MLIIFSLLISFITHADPAECYKEAIQLKDRHSLGTTSAQALRLCKGVSSPKLVLKCYKGAQEEKDSFGMYLVKDPISLCAGARDYSPLECFRKARQTKDQFGSQLSAEYAFNLCARETQP
jgi:hypothetical protein